MRRLYLSLAMAALMMVGSADTVMAQAQSKPWYQPLAKKRAPSGPLRIWCQDPAYREKSRETWNQCQWVFRWVRTYETPADARRYFQYVRE